MVTKSETASTRVGGRDPWAGHDVADPDETLKALRSAEPGAAGAAGRLARGASGETMEEETLGVLSERDAKRLMTAAGSVRPDLNGLRVKSPAAPHVYLIDRGVRRHIPDPPTYENLFRSWNGIIVDINITDITLGLPITPGAVLAKASNHPAIYLIDHAQKRWIVSPPVFDKYYFAWNRVVVVPPVLINSIPTGSNITD